MREQKESKISGTTHAILMNDGALESIFSLVSGKIKKKRIGSHFGLQIACQRAPGEFEPEVFMHERKESKISETTCSISTRDGSSDGIFYLVSGKNKKIRNLMTFWSSNSLFRYYRVLFEVRFTRKRKESKNSPTIRPISTGDGSSDGIFDLVSGNVNKQMESGNILVADVLLNHVFAIFRIREQTFTDSFLH